MMIQLRFIIDDDHAAFLSNYKTYGFKDESAVIRTALQQLKEELDRRHLEQSADLYAETYESDSDLKDLTDTAVSGGLILRKCELTNEYRA